MLCKLIIFTILVIGKVTDVQAGNCTKMDSRIRCVFLTSVEVENLNIISLLSDRGRPTAVALNSVESEYKASNSSAMIHEVKSTFSVDYSVDSFNLTSELSLTSYDSPDSKVLKCFPVQATPVELLTTRPKLRVSPKPEMSIDEHDVEYRNNDDVQFKKERSTPVVLKSIELEYNALNATAMIHEMKSTLSKEFNKSVVSLNAIFELPLTIYGYPDDKVRDTPVGLLSTVLEYREESRGTEMSLDAYDTKDLNNEDGEFKSGILLTSMDFLGEHTTMQAVKNDGLSRAQMLTLVDLFFIIWIFSCLLDVIKERILLLL